MPKKFSYQRSFATAIKRDWKAVYNTVVPDFHSGWKQIVGAPSHGNHNPNYADVLAMCRAVLQEGATDLSVPYLPFERQLQLPGRIGRVVWQLTLNIYRAWRLLVENDYKRPQLSGALAHLLEIGILESWDAEYILLAAEDYYAENCPQLSPNYELVCP